MAFGPLIPYGKELNITDAFVPFAAERHLTSQYSMEMIFISRVQHHPRRTVFRDRASVAVLPVFLFCAQWYPHPKSAIQRDLVALYNRLLDTSKFGEVVHVPHILLYGDVLWNAPSYFPQCCGAKPLPQNTYLITLEEHALGYPSMTPSRVISVPFPSSLHRKLDVSINGDEAQAPQVTAEQGGELTRRRKYLVCYYGRHRSPADELAAAVASRTILETDVKMVFLEHMVGWRTLNNVKTTAAVLEFFVDCDFVLSPYGDMGTRRSFFDAVAVGAVPVVFESNFQRYNAMFRGKAGMDIAQMSVTYKPVTAATASIVADPVHFVNFFRSIPTPDITRMRTYMQQHLRKLQYSLAHDDHDAVAMALQAVRTVFREDNPGSFRAATGGRRAAA